MKDKCKGKAYSILLKATIQLNISQHFWGTVNSYINYKSTNLDCILFFYLTHKDIMHSAENQEASMSFF